MAHSGLAESLIENEIGCGPFQVLIVLFLFNLVKIPCLSTIVFMSYGNYNPGWRCLDNYNHTNHTNHTLLPNISLVNASAIAGVVRYKNDKSCAAFEACTHVEFNPESSTIVTEWGLTCDKAWIPAFIISLQMAGHMMGTTISGQLVDRIGRKKTMYGSLLITSVLTFVSIFSTSWEIFAASRFILGILTPFYRGMDYMYTSEFLTKKWRGPVGGLPSWGVAGVLFGLTTMLLKDWRYLLITTSSVCFISFLPVLWIPESLRWLEVKGKKTEFDKVAMKMAKFNGKKFQVGRAVFEKNITTSNVDTKRYTPLDLFRPGYRSFSTIIGLVWVILNLLFDSLAFGVKAFHGNFYVNLILIYALLIPCAVFPFFAPNILGRRLGSLVFMSLAGVCFFGATVLEKFSDGATKTLGTLVFLIIAEVGVDTTFCTQQVHVSEIYPTVVRGVGLNGAAFIGRLGAMVSPFLIPDDPEMVYLWFLIMGCLGLLASGLISRLPETRGKPMKETFGDNTESETQTL